MSSVKSSRTLRTSRRFRLFKKANDDHNKDQIGNDKQSPISLESVNSSNNFNKIKNRYKSSGISSSSYEDNGSSFYWLIKSLSRSNSNSNNKNLSNINDYDIEKFNYILDKLNKLNNDKHTQDNDIVIGCLIILIKSLKNWIERKDEQNLKVIFNCFDLIIEEMARQEEKRKEEKTEHDKNKEINDNLIIVAPDTQINGNKLYSYEHTSVQDTVDDQLDLIIKGLNDRLINIDNFL